MPDFSCNLNNADYYYYLDEFGLPLLDPTLGPIPLPLFEKSAICALLPFLAPWFAMLPAALPPFKWLLPRTAAAETAAAAAAAAGELLFCFAFLLRELGDRWLLLLLLPAAPFGTGLCLGRSLRFATAEAAD